MNKELWGTPHSPSVVFDKVSVMDKLQSSKMAMKLIESKPEIKTPKETMAWVRQAMALLGKTVMQTIQENESLRYLVGVSKGLFDSNRVGSLLFDMEGHIEQLESDKLLDGKAAEITHDAITHWAKLEAETNV